jgi:hypothetical protein
VVSKTITSGFSAVTAGTINSIVASVTFDDKNGFGFSRDNFVNGLKGSAISAITGMTGTFTSGLMNMGLNGFTNSIFEGGKKLYGDGQKLSALMGGLASQGVNYAFGNDFTLNLFNAGIFSKKDFNAGLVEMRLGRNGRYQL